MSEGSLPVAPVLLDEAEATVALAAAAREAAALEAAQALGAPTTPGRALARVLTMDALRAALGRAEAERERLCLPWEGCVAEAWGDRDPATGEPRRRRGSLGVVEAKADAVGEGLWRLRSARAVGQDGPWPGPTLNWGQSGVLDWALRHPAWTVAWSEAKAAAEGGEDARAMLRARLAALPARVARVLTPVRPPPEMVRRHRAALRSTGWRPRGEWRALERSLDRFGFEALRAESWGLWIEPSGGLPLDADLLVVLRLDLPPGFGVAGPPAEGVWL